MLRKCFYPIGYSPGALFNEYVNTVLWLQESQICACTWVMAIYTTVLTVNRCSLLPVRLLLVGHSGHWCGCSDKYNCASCWRCSLLPVWLLLVGCSSHWCSCSESWGVLTPLSQWGLLPKGKLQRTRLSMSSISSTAYFATHTNKSNS